MFEYNYVPPEELVPEDVIFTPGEGHYSILSFYETNKDGSELMTREGDKMLRLVLLFTDCKGKKGTLIDNLVGNPKNAWKIKQIMDSIGKPNLYSQQASFHPEELLGMQGRAIVKTQSNPAYKDKSVIGRYLPYDDQFKGSVSFKDSKDEDDDDSIPF